MSLPRSGTQRICIVTPAANEPLLTVVLTRWDTADNHNNHSLFYGSLKPTATN